MLDEIFVFIEEVGDGGGCRDVKTADSAFADVDATGVAAAAA